MLNHLFHDGLRLLERAPEIIACPTIIRALNTVLADPKTRTLIKQDLVRDILYEQIGGLTILGHHHPESVWSEPHDHGRTWAIYGQVTGKTAMYEYQKLDDTRVQLKKSYWIMPGEAYWFPTGAVHSHKTYGDSKLIRIEGMNLWRRENDIGGSRYDMVSQEVVQ